MNQKSVLQDAGRISRQLAFEKAEMEYNKFKTSERALQHFESIKELDADLKKYNKNKNSIS